MLVLSRQRDESIMIGDKIVVTIVDIRGDRVRLGIQAPEEIPVHRQEVYKIIQQDGQHSAKADYDYVGPVHEGLARAIKDDQEFHVRPDGTPAYAERYDCVDHFYNGTAFVRKGHERFFIRPNGTRVVEEE